MATTPRDPKHVETFAIVGELVLLFNALDYQTGAILVELLHMGDATFALPVILTLESNRKVELIKARIAHIRNAVWKKNIASYVSKVEAVSKQRNIVCHTPAVLTNGVWEFAPLAGAKMLKQLDLEAKKHKRIPIANVRDAVSVAEAALGMGEGVLHNLRLANAAQKARIKK